MNDIQEEHQGSQGIVYQGTMVMEVATVKKKTPVFFFGILLVAQHISPATRAVGCACALRASDHP